MLAHSHGYYDFTDRMESPARGGTAAHGRHHQGELATQHDLAPTRKPECVSCSERLDEKSVRLVAGLTVQQLSAALDSVEWRNPGVDANALRGLKFSAALPDPLAKETLSVRLGDSETAESVVAEARTIIMQQR
jgi:hypothetical protein